MGQRDPTDIDMRLGKLGGLGNHNVSMYVNRGGRRPPGKAVSVMIACGGAAIAVLAIVH
jgi:hypothetical protein